MATAKFISVTALPLISSEPAELRWVPSFDNAGSIASILGLLAALAAHRRSVLNAVELQKIERVTGA